MTKISQIKLPNNVTYDLKDNGALQLTGGSVTGPTFFNTSLYADDLTTGTLIVNGNARFVGDIYGDLTGNLAGVASKASAANINSTVNAIAYYTNTAGTFGSKASANGALYATAANGALQWGTLPIGQGGTGLTASPSMLTNLGSTTAANVLQASPRPGITGTLGAANGGTGQTSLTAAGSAIINSLSEGASPATRNDYIVAQYAGGGTTTQSYHRRSLANIFKALNKDDITTALGYTPPTTNTTYSSLAAASGGTAVSLVTTGEKYTWNSKANGDHTHYYIKPEGDKRAVATTPNDYNNILAFKGLKNNSTIGSPSTNAYSYLVGLRGWGDSSGGNSHELAFNDNGIFTRNGATTSWGNWEKVLTDKNMHFKDINPLVHKTYESTSYYATAGTWEATSWYFMSVKPDAWYKPWTVRFKVHSHCPGYANVDSISYCTVSGRADSLIYSIWNERYDPAHYYIPYYALKKAGFDAGYGHAIGISILYGTGYTTAAYYRTFEVEYFGCEDCTVNILDSPVHWANWSGTGTTNYNGLNSMDAINRGMKESGDNNDTTTLQYATAQLTAGTNGIKMYSLVMQDTSGTWQSFTTGAGGVGTSKAKNTIGFIPGQIYYMSRSADLAANGLTGTSVIRTTQDWVDFRYSSNCGTTLTAYKMIYIKGTMENGLFYLADTWWTQTPPTSADGFVYIPVGMAYSSYTYSFWGWHGMYYHDGTSLKSYENSDVKTDGSTKMTGNLIIRKAGTGANDWASRTSNPSLIFEATDDQTAGFIYTQYDSVAAPDSVTLAGSQAGTYFIAPNIKATTSFHGNLSGHATSATTSTSTSRLAQNSEMTYAWNGVNYFNVSAANQSAAKVNDTPFTAATWTHILRFNHANSAGYYTDLAVPFNANSIYYKRIAGGTLQNSSTNGGWVKVLDQLNYTDYTVTKTGSGASGTWGISISGNATTATNTKYLLNRGASTVSIDDGVWAHGQTPSGHTNRETIWHQRWKQSGITYTPSGGSATTNTDTADLVYWLSSSNTNNTLQVNVAIDGMIYALGGFKGNLNGTATSATTASSLSGFTNTTTSGTAIDSATQNGHVYVTGTSGIYNQNDGAAFVQAYSTSWVAQIYQDYRTGQIALRGKNNGTWQAWRKVIDSSNYTSLISMGSLSGLTKSQVTTALGYTPPTTNTTYGVVSKTANGLAPQLPNETSTTKFLRQDGTWAVPTATAVWG